MCKRFFCSSAFSPPGSLTAWTSSAYWLFPPSLSCKPSQWLSLFSLLAPFLRQQPLFSLLLLFARQFSLTLLSFLLLPFSLTFPAISLSLSLFPLSCLCFHYLAFLSSPLLLSPHASILPPPRLIGLRVAFHHARTHTQHHPSSVSQFVNELSAHQWFFSPFVHSYILMADLCRQCFYEDKTCVCVCVCVCWVCVCVLGGTRGVQLLHDK